MLASVYSYRVMVKSVSSCCVRGSRVLSNPVTYMYVRIIISNYMVYLHIECQHPQSEHSCVLQFHCVDTGQVLIQFQYTVHCLAKLVQFPDQNWTHDMQKLHVGNQAVDTQQWHHLSPTSHHTLYPTGHKIFPHVLHYQMNHLLDESYHF